MWYGEMPYKIIREWEGDQREPLLTRIGGIFARQSPMKEKIALSIHRLKIQSNRLESSAIRLMQRDKEFFAKVVQAQMQKDFARATMYANECAEIRKMAKVVLSSQLALERVLVRLETIQEFGEVAALMKPVSEVVHSIKGQISGIMPEVSFELSQIGEVLDEIVMEAGEAGGSEQSMAPSPEAEVILKEAAAIAEQRMKERFPELPGARPSIGEGRERYDLK